MKQILILLVIGLSTASFAQHPTCDGARYLTSQFTPDTTLAVQFGSGTTYGGVQQDLFVDIFEPSGDVAVNRPLIILAFGGSFIGGTREDMHSYCAYYASMGYVAASIDYRLYDIFGIPDSVAMTDVVMKSVSDMKAAIRFFREDAATSNMYKIDTNLIFVGGISAGGIVANHAGLLQSSNSIQPYIQTILDNNGGWTGNSSTNTQYSDQVAGILNYSGALKWASYIDSQDPPVFSVHDDQDGTVPYGTGDAVVFGFPIITMEGSSKMKLRLDAEGVYNELITIPNSTGHVSYFSNQVAADSILIRSLEFLYPIVCNQPASLENNEVSDWKIYPNPSADFIAIELQDAMNVRLNVVDVSGRIVLTQEFLGAVQQIDVSDLNPGKYWIELTNIKGGTRTDVKSFVKY